MTYKIHFVGSFSPQQVDTQWVASTLSIPPELQLSIETKWSAALRDSGKMLFDGPLCRVESWRLENGRLNLALSHTSYKWFWGTNLSGTNLPTPAFANALGLSAALESSDGFLLFGRRNLRMAYHPNRIHPFAGSATDKNVFAEIERELVEELNFTPSDISDIRCIGMAEDLAIRQPELVFHVRSSLTREQIESRLDRSEHDGIWVQGDQGELTPIAQAVLKLCGKVQA